MNFTRREVLTASAALLVPKRETQHRAEIYPAEWDRDTEFCNACGSDAREELQAKDWGTEGVALLCPACVAQFKKEIKMGMYREFHADPVDALLKDAPSDWRFREIERVRKNIAKYR